MATDYTDILNEAHQAAQAAVKDGKDDGACGFAWVVSRHRRLNLWCKKQFELSEAIPSRFTKEVTYGHKNYGGGWCWWKPGNFNGQAVLVHEAGAQAFCQVLKQKLGDADFFWSSRLD